MPQENDILVNVTDATFDGEVLASDIPVVVDFWASWCGPCRQIAPYLEEIAAELQGKIKVAKLDADSNPDQMMKYNVRGLPTLLIFRHGEPIATQVGAANKSKLLEWIRSNI